MIIVEQDNTYFVNYNNVICITVAVDEEETEYAIVAKMVKDNEIVLGIYNTEERAKEVLQEIVKCYKDTNYEYENCWCLRNLVYEMPEE